MADATTDEWDAGLELICGCPHCGVPVYVRPSERNPVTGMPAVVYLCSCRVLAATAAAMPAAPVAPPPAAPFRMPIRWPLPASPRTPAVPAQPRCPSPIHPVGPYIPDRPFPGLPGGPPDITCAARPAEQ